MCMIPDKAVTGRKNAVYSNAMCASPRLLFPADDPNRLFQVMHFRGRTI
jgi:hypothetical protein